MNQTHKKHSLIRYLTGDENGITLSIPLSSWVGPAARHRIQPAGRYSRTIDAVIQTDAGDTLCKVSMVVQPDHYDTVDSLMPQPTNATVDAAWQRALAFHQFAARASGYIGLGGQMATGSDIHAFDPLFHCRHSGNWFAPVCPSCGDTLGLCRNDELLAGHGLPTYAGSLSRYLTCDACLAHGRSPRFFCPRKESDAPDCVFDLDDLIRMWQPLAGQPTGGSGLPCADCGSTDACYGNRGDAAANIHAFAFYPFHLILTRTPDFSGERFVRFIGGDPAAEAAFAHALGSPSAGSPFLFADDARHFLEVLYLKLTFLKQVCRHFLPDASGTAPDVALRLDGIGVDMPRLGVGLPFAWQFNTRVIDVVGSFSDAPFTPLTPLVPRFGFLGALWFRTLLVNAHQRAAEVFDQVGKRATATADEKNAVDNAGRMFAPDQIFWHPSHIELTGEERSFWQTALQYGLDLVRAGMIPGEHLDTESFIESIDALSGRIKERLFAPRTIASVVDRPADAMTSEAAAARMHSVLQSILAKWKGDVEAANRPAMTPTTADTAAVPASDDIEATVVFQSPDTGVSSWAADDAVNDGPADDPSTTGQDRMGDPADGWDDAPETIVYSGQASLSDASDRRNTDAPDGPPDDQATVVINRPVDPVERADVHDAPMDPDQTIVISPASVSGISERTDANADEDLAATIHQPPSAHAALDTGGWDDDLAQTVVMSGTPAAGAGRPSEDDALAATIVQRPDAQPERRAVVDREPVASPAGPSPDTGDFASDTAETVIFSRAPVSPRPTNPDDDLAATVVQRAASEKPISNAPPGPPPIDPEREKDGDDEEDIMAQTIIIRSDVRKDP